MTKTLNYLKKKMAPPQIITISFIGLILFGAFLLNLPMSSNSGDSIGFLNALFTSTSAVCVTGLVVVNTLSHWSVFGKVVILFLIQIGALGFMTILTLFMLIIRKQISLKDRLVIQTSFNQADTGGIVRLIKDVIMYTFAIELMGAFFLFIAFFVSTPMSIKQAAINGIFHSISAFCNAGFDIIGTESLMPYQDNLAVNIIIMSLIVAGGLGFTVIGEMHRILQNKKQWSFQKRLKHLSLHTKIALTLTTALLLSGLLIFLLLEWTNQDTLGMLPFTEKVTAAAFQSVTLRTAGFNTIDQGKLTEASQFVSCIFMIIGGSPAGTAGGIKTVTFGVIIISMISVLKGRDKIEVFGRTLPVDLLQKALTVACAMMIVVVTSTLILCFSEQGNAFKHSFLDLLFECTSAVGTVGISTGLTPYLTSIGKFVIIICMFLGRLSPVTVVMALNMRLHAAENSISFIEERVIIG